jgi:hypothetical protein
MHQLTLTTLDFKEILYAYRVSRVSDNYEVSFLCQLLSNLLHLEFLILSFP